MSKVTIAGLTLDGVPVEMGAPGSGHDGYVVTYKHSNREMELLAPAAVAGAGVGGKVCTVDDVYGNDSTGARSGKPFKTITAALAAAQSGDCVYVLPGIYNESITIPDGVSLIGISERAVTIQKLLVTADTTLVTMGQNTRFSGFSLVLTSAQHHTLIGIAWPGQSTQNSSWQNSRLTIDNSGAGAGTSNVYGVYANGTDTVPDITYAAKDLQITIKSTGSGNKRGLLVVGGTSFNCTGVNIGVTGGASCIGAEVNHASGIIRMSVSTVSGATADISQTSGIVELGSVDLLNANANQLGFNADLLPLSVPLVFAHDGNVASGTRYLRPGTGTISTTPVVVRIPRKAVIRAISVHAASGPGGGRTDTWTVQINGVDTIVSTSLTGTATVADNQSVSAGSNGAFDLSVKQVGSNGSASNDVVVVVGIY